MGEKDKNYVSAVVYLGDEQALVQPFLQALTGALGARFERYELVLVNDASRDGSEGEMREFLQKMEAPPPVTIIHLSLKQGLEMAMNAGLDMAVGDYVWEFDTMDMPYPAHLILDAYDACLGGKDIVSVCPEKNRGVMAGLFYKLFNAASRAPTPLRTDLFRLLSRRAINRVRALSAATPYRKAAYAASGLAMESLAFPGKAGKAAERLRFSRAVNSLALYTNAASRLSLVVAGLMLLLMLAALVYTLVVYLGGATAPAEGWTTTMLLLTGGFFGVFLVLAIVLKYLSLLVELVFRRQAYLVERVEKLP